MALIIYLKENKAVVANGNGESLVKEIQTALENDAWVSFTTTEGNKALIASEAINYIETITEKELDRRKQAFEAEQKRAQQRQGMITTPNMIFPKGN